MRQATNSELFSDYSLLPETSRFSLRSMRTKPAISGTERALFRSGVPQNPMRILEVASKVLPASSREIRYGVCSDFAFIEWIDGETQYHDRQVVHPDIERSESECLACMSILRRLAEKHGKK